MPPKVKITKNDIIETALGLCRENGEESINARSIAAALSCSTQPIFSNFSTMEELKEATIAAAYERYLEFSRIEVESGRYPKYKAFGMAYIRFAKEKKELFKLLFMRDRRGESLAPTSDFEASVDIIMKSNGIGRKEAELFHLENWTFVHGIATMLATSFLPLDWELISSMMSDVYQGLILRHAAKEE